MVWNLDSLDELGGRKMTENIRTKVGKLTLPGRLVQSSHAVFLASKVHCWREAYKWGC